MDPPEQGRTRDEVRSDDPPPRPATKEDLPFRRSRAVRWFSPGTLTGAALRVVISSLFGAYLDKRELQAAITAQALDHWAGADELWIDYLADTGDGFDATYTMAWLAAQEQLSVPGVDVPLRRGNVVVLGGDEVYPVGDAEAYEHRFVGPYQAALPWTPPGQNPDIYCVAGNHDWYDGLTAFLRIVGQQKWIGGRRTRQTRSYFAVQLPHRWWLWGIDIQFDAYLDEPQLRFFERVKPLMRRGDRVILCTAEPSWIDVKSDPGAFRNLAYVEKFLIRPAGAKLMLTLSGDSHHYAHYYAARDGTHKVTAGGAGAFLHPTHDLEDVVEIQVDPADEDKACPYDLTACYPGRRASRGMALGALALPFLNPSFMLVPGGLYALLGWASQFSLRAFEQQVEDLPLVEAAPDFGWLDLAVGLARNPISLLLILLFLGALIGFAKPPHKWAANPPRLILKIALGVVHTLAHLVAVVTISLLAIRVVSQFADGAWFTFWLVVATGVLGGLAGGLVTGAYLTLCNVTPGFDAHGNEAFSAQRLPTYKNFLRLHLDNTGLLHVYAIGVRRPVKSRDWVFDPGGRGSDSWLKPKGDPPRTHLIEKFTVGGGS